MLWNVRVEFGLVDNLALPNPKSSVQHRFCFYPKEARHGFLMVANLKSRVLKNMRGEIIGCKELLALSTLLPGHS